MQNLENEKLTWEAPRLILESIIETEVGASNVPSGKGQHQTSTITVGVLS